MHPRAHPHAQRRAVPRRGVLRPCVAPESPPSARSSSARARLHPSACARSGAFLQPAVHQQQGSNAGTSSAQALPARPAWRRAPCPRGLRVPGSSRKFPEVGIAPCPLLARASRLALARSAWGAAEGTPRARSSVRQGQGLHRPAASRPARSCGCLQGRQREARTAVPSRAGSLCWMNGCSFS